MSNNEWDEAANPAIPANELAPLAELADGPPTSARAANGRFLTGNNGGGRPKGSRNRLTNLVMDAIIADFEANGAAAVANLRQSDPATYLRLVSGLVPRELVVQREREPDIDLEHIELGEWMELIERLKCQALMRNEIIKAQMG